MKRSYISVFLIVAIVFSLVVSADFFTAPASASAPIQYTHDTLGFSLTLPADWQGLYTVRTHSTIQHARGVDFYNTRNSNAGFGGFLFGIIVSDSSISHDAGTLQFMGLRLLQRIDGKYYYFRTPTDLQYSMTTPALRNEYSRMSSALPNISRSFQGPVTVILDGNELDFEVPPRLIGGRAMVPLRMIFEEMGANVDWNPNTETVTATKGDTTVVMRIGSTSPTVNGEVVSLDQPSIIVNGRSLAPLRFVAEAFGGRVVWDSETQRATITTPTPPVPETPTPAAPDTPAIPETPDTPDTPAE